MSDKNEVISSVLISEEKANNIEEAIRKSQFAMALAVNNNIMDIALKATEAVEQKVHVLRGYKDDMNGASAYLNETFGIKNTQRKTYAIVTHKFARRVEGSSEYQLLDPRFRDFGIENLNEIQKLPDFDNSSVEALNKFMDSHNITSDTTKVELQKMRGIEDKSQKKTEEKKTEETNTEEASQPVAEDNVTTQLKAENDKLNVTVNDTRSELSKLYQLALDKKINDKKFREEALEILKRLEKKFQ